MSTFCGIGYDSHRLVTGRPLLLGGVQIPHELGPSRSAIRSSLAQALGLEPARVNVKASTGEGIGFVGRGEGVAALAVASVERAG